MFDIIDTFYDNNIFLFELLFAYLPFIPLVKPKKHWWITSVISVVALAVISHFVFQHFRDQHWAIASLWYLLTAVITVVVLKISSESNWWFAIFVGTGAYAVQHLFYRCKRLVDIILVMYDKDELYDYLYWVVMAIVLLGIYFLAIRKLKKEKNFKVNNIRLIVVSIISITVLITLNLFEMRELIAHRLWFSPIAIILMLFGILTCSFLLNNLFANVYNKKIEEELAVIQSLWESDRRQYKQSKQNIELLNMKYHDLKYQINALLRSEQTLSDENALKEAIQCLNVYDATFKTGNDTLDVVLTEKKLQCDLLKIQFSCMAQGELLSHMRPVDIYSIFGNALDNAIDCLKKVEEEDLRFVNVIVKPVNNIVKIQIENYTPSKVEIKDGFPVTTKKNKDNHGFGLKSIYYIVEKYNGVLHFSVKDDMFLLEIALPAEEQK